MTLPDFELQVGTLFDLARNTLVSIAGHIATMLQFVPTTLLGFVRGPALQVATLIMIAGMIWRLSAILLLRHRLQLATARRSFIRRASSGIKMIFIRSIPRKTFRPRIAVSVASSTVFHLGFLIIILGGAPHIGVIRESRG